MRKWIDLTFVYWKWVVLLTVCATLIFAYFIKDLKIDNAIETITIDDDPDLELLLAMEREFGADEFIVISFYGEDLFSPSVLSMIEKMTLRIEKIENVEGVLSLSNALIPEDRPDGFGTYPFIPRKWFKEGAPGHEKEKVIQNKFYRRWILSEDGLASSILVWVAPVGNDDSARWKIVNDVNKVIKEEQDQRKFYIYGLPYYQKEIIDAMLRDQYYVTSVVFIVIGMILYFLFRDIKLIIIPFVLISLCSLWSLGLLVACGSTLNYVTNILPVVLLIVCICGSVHIMTHYKETRFNGQEKTLAIRKVIASIGTPILLTGITTCIGFFSLASNKIKPVRDFGIYTGMGVFFAILLSLTLLPLIMSTLTFKKRREEKKDAKGGFEPFLHFTGKFVNKRKNAILFLSLLLTALSIVGMTKIEVRQDIVSMLKKTAALDEADRFIDTHLGGSCEFDILVQGKEAYSLLEPENLNKIARIQERAEKEAPFLRKTVSIVDILKEVNQAMNDNAPEAYRLPDTKEEALELLEISFSDEGGMKLSSIVNEDYTHTRIRIFSESGDNSHEADDAMNAYSKIAQEENASSLKVSFTGRPKVFFNMVDSLISAMVSSFSLAFAVIFIIMILVFRSFTIGLLSMIVNVIPACVTFGIIGWFNIPLNLMTAMVPSIAIGIAVDDTIHFIWRFQEELKRYGDYKQAVLQSLLGVGEPIITTSLVICAGFSVFYFSEIVLVTQFGLLTITTVIAALAADLFLGPALFLVFKPIKVKKPEADSDASYITTNFKARSGLGAPPKEGAASFQAES